MFLRLFNSLKSHPFAFACFCGVAKDSSCDIMVQKTQGSTRTHDWRRTAVFATFGGTFVGAWQYVLFNVMLPRVSPMPVGFFALPIAKR